MCLCPSAPGPEAPPRSQSGAVLQRLAAQRQPDWSQPSGLPGEVPPPTCACPWSSSRRFWSRLLFPVFHLLSDVLLVVCLTFSSSGFLPVHSGVQPLHPPSRPGGAGPEGPPLHLSRPAVPQPTSILHLQLLEPSQRRLHPHFLSVAASYNLILKYDEHDAGKTEQ